MRVLNPYKTTQLVDYKELWLPFPYKPLPNTVTVITHEGLSDAMKYIPTEIMIQSLVCIDESDRLMNQTARTAAGYQLAATAKEEVIMTGTPSIDSNFMKARRWLQLSCHFPVTKHNIWVATTSLIAHHINTGNTPFDKDVIVKLNDEEKKVFLQRADVKIGGHNRFADSKDNLMAVKQCESACHRGMVDYVVEKLKEAQCSGIHMVVHDKKQLVTVYEMLLSKGISAVEIYRVGPDGSGPIVTPENKLTELPKVRIIISPIRESRSWTATRMNEMVTCIFPSNEADREQMRARIDRIVNVPRDITYTTFLDDQGFFARIRRGHLQAKDINTAIREAISIAI